MHYARLTEETAVGRTIVWSKQQAIGAIEAP